MQMHCHKILLTAAFAMLIAACSRNEPPAAPAMVAVDPPPAAEVSLPDAEWRQHGLNEGETRFSPLADVNDGNVNTLGLAWYFDYPTARGLEATPLIIDGVMYTTGSWSMVFANNAITGELLWCCDNLNLLPNTMAPYVGDKNYPAQPSNHNHSDYPAAGYCDDLYATHCLDFVRTNAKVYNETGRPFFALLAVQIPHAPFGEIEKLPGWDAAYKDDKHFAGLAHFF